MPLDPPPPMTQETKDFILWSVYNQTCNPDNKDNLVNRVTELQNTHKIVLGIATGLGAFLTVVANYFKLGSGTGGHS